VLMSMALYQQLTGGPKKISDLLAMPGIEDVDLDIPRFPDIARPADLS
jgi:hypothetical protein